MIEFGFNSRVGVKVEADSYLRAALYPNTTVILEHIRQRLQAVINQANHFA